MKLEEALPFIDNIIGKKFNMVFDAELIQNLRTNKGNVGQLLERSIGLENSSKRLDFENGELKTNKAHPNGKPKETMYIIQILSIIDDILIKKPFKETLLYQKIRNLVYVPVCKDGSEDCWFFLPYVHVNLDQDAYVKLYRQLEKDYYSIVEQLNNHIKTSRDGFIHTSNGKYIQIRSKDSKPYHPIYSNIYRKYVSNKNHAFYFKKEFMLYLQSLSPDYPL
ncbi:MAG: DNA mismatch repair protein MutH [Firmicutes bacterium HGW-Firmicutes-13]|nr:MAG: DNA mismatch repair protein MutH [Firmicutes bacterium HGW-Firmicutes-13]